MKYAIIDLGSNTARLSVYNVNEDKSFKLLFSEKEAAGLVNYVENKVLTEDGILKACEVINNFLKLLEQLSIPETYVFATASLRNIKNTSHACDVIQEKTGTNIDVISGYEEAAFAFSGVLNSKNAQSGIMFDIGGGSSEVLQFENQKIILSKSFDFGCLNLTNMFVKKIFPSKEEMAAIKEKIKSSFDISGYAKSETLYGVGGTARALLRISNQYYNKNGSCQIDASEFKSIKKIIFKKDEEAKKLILKACPDRIYTIITGILIIDTLMKKFHSKKILVSNYGVREGYLCQKIIASMT